MTDLNKLLTEYQMKQSQRKLQIQTREDYVDTVRIEQMNIKELQ